MNEGMKLGGPGKIVSADETWFARKDTTKVASWGRTTLGREALEPTTCLRTEIASTEARYKSALFGWCFALLCESSGGKHSVHCTEWTVALHRQRAPERRRRTPGQCTDTRATWLEFDLTGQNYVR
eukprot:5020174-Amphidinium_carterae.1